MQKFISNKPCRFGERNFMIGEEIPADLIAPARVPALLKYGTIVTVEVPDKQPAPAPVEPEQTDPAATGENSEEPHAEEQAPVEPEQQEKAAKGNGRKAQK